MIGGNGKGKARKIKYPVNYKLKLIMDNSIPKSVNIKNVSDKLEELKIDYGSFSSVLSKNETYISLTVQVRITSDAQFRILYIELKNIEGLKTAI